MRVALAVAFLVAMSFAGCVAPEQVAANDVLSSANAEARTHFNEPIFLGMAAFEGTVDLEKLESTLREEAAEEGMEDEVDEFLDAFDFRQPQGDIGDGLPGSWFTAHTDQDFSALLLTQVGSGGVIGSYLWEEDDAGYTDEAEPEPMRLAWMGALLDVPSLVPALVPTLAPAVAPVSSAAASSTTSAETCTFNTKVEWRIGSERAAAIANAQPEFAAHVAENPDAEYLYVYVPMYYEDCYGEQWEDGNMWAVVHVDLDTILAGEWPTIAYVIMDASNGTVIDGGVEVPTEWRVLVDDQFSFTGPLVPTLGVFPAATGSTKFEVPADALYVSIVAYGDGTLRILGPDGAVMNEAMQLVSYWSGAPAAGTWTIDTTMATTRPNEPFGFRVSAEVEVPIGDA